MQIQPQAFNLTWMGGVLIFIALIGMFGCEAENAIKRGDRAMGVGSHEEAYRQYQIARSYKPQLTNQDGFVDKYLYAKSRAAYDVAQRRAAGGDWETALAKYAEAVEVDGDFELARAGLEVAREKAAVDYHRRALGEADVDRLAEADRMLRRALELAPSQSQAREALDSIKSPTMVGSWVEGLAARDARKWPEAIGLFGLVVKDWPNHLAARAQKFRATAQLNKSNGLARRGKVELEAKDLDRAIGSLTEALGVWPFNAGAQTDLRGAEALKGQAVFRFDAAVGHAEAGRWDHAIIANDAALALFPSYAKAKVYRPQLRLDAAGDMLRMGEERLLAGAADGARDAFHRALVYEPGHGPAKMGLARVSAWRGDRAAGENRWGEAVLWYMEAETHYAGKAYRAKIDAARGRVLGRVVFGLGTEVVDDRGHTSSHSLAMDQRLQAVLARTAPGFVRVGEAATGAPKVYHGRVTVTGTTIQRRVAKTEKLRHKYTTYRDIPNPHVYELRHEVTHARNELAELEQKFHERCHVCGGDGYSACGSCGGRGRMACPTHQEPRSEPRSEPRQEERREPRREERQGQEVHQRDPRGPRGEGGVRGFSTARVMQFGIGRTVAMQACGTCGGSRSVDCSRCGGSGRRKCSHCGGSGKRHRVSSRDVDRARSRLGHLERELVLEPLLITEAVVQWWPYEVRHHVMEGTMRTTVGFGFDGAKEGGGKREGKGGGFNSKWVLKDAEVVGANPKIGLGADPLVLAEQGDVVAALLDDAAREAGRRLLGEVVGYRVNELLAEAAGHGAAGRGVEKLEAEVAAALMRESVNAKSGRAMLAGLRPGG